MSQLSFKAPLCACQTKTLAATRGHHLLFCVLTSAHGILTWERRSYTWIYDSYSLVWISPLLESYIHPPMSPFKKKSDYASIVELRTPASSMPVRQICQCLKRQKRNRMSSSTFFQAALSVGYRGHFLYATKPSLLLISLKVFNRLYCKNKFHLSWSLECPTGQLLTSSPSFRTMVPAFSTTANTITAQSSLLTDMVMFAKAGNWCMNSKSCSKGEEMRWVIDGKMTTSWEVKVRHMTWDSDLYLCLSGLYSKLCLLAVWRVSGDTLATFQESVTSLKWNEAAQLNSPAGHLHPIEYGSLIHGN